MLYKISIAFLITLLASPAFSETFEEVGVVSKVNTLRQTVTIDDQTYSLSRDVKLTDEHDYAMALTNLKAGDLLRFSGTISTPYPIIENCAIIKRNQVIEPGEQG